MESSHSCSKSSIEFCGQEFDRATIDKAIQSKQLLSMELGLSRACNLNCIYCYSDAGSCLENELDHETILSAIKQAHDLGAKKIVVLGGGEPLIYPQISEVLSVISNLNMNIELFTNAMLITPELARALFDMKADVIVKKNSLKPELQDKLADHIGASQKMNVGLQELLNAGYPAAECNIGIETIICAQNIDEIPDIWRYARNNGFKPYIESMTIQGRAKQHPELYVSPERVKEVFFNLAEIDAKEFAIHWEPKPPLASFACQRHLYSASISETGNVTPCPGVDIVVGNIRNTPLKDIIENSTVFQELRAIYDKIKGECRECEQNQECYGCRGNAYNRTGDYLASDPDCWIKQQC